MALNSTLYNCRGNPEIVTRPPSAATGLSSEPTISLHSSFMNTTKDALFDRKIDIATEGLEMQYVNRLRTLQPENAMIVVNYIQAMRTEINLSDNYRKLNIFLLSDISKFHNKPIKQMSREDLLSYLDSFRKSDASDPLHKWVGTYNLYTVLLIRFFRWLYYQDIEQKKRPKPSVVDNIPQLKRKEKSIYKPTDLWTTEDDLLFYKYCPSKRIKCYHAISRDTSCRPHEILKLKIKEIFFKTAGNYQYAEVLVNGKTGTRHIPLIDSIPYLKDYLDHEHSQPSNPNAILICSMKKTLGRIMTTHYLFDIYSRYKKEFFPRLLDNPNVPHEDKQKIKELLKKPWNPYIRRHSALTEKSKILKEHVLRQHSGWSISSQMPQKYLHYYGNESSESLLEAYGIVPKDQQIDQLRPKQCPNCSEPNKTDSKFCAKCRMVLTYDAYNETLEKQQEKESEVHNLKEKYEQDMKSMREEMENKFQQILAKIDVATLK
jgi:integrase/recombinase XerD